MRDDTKNGCVTDGLSVENIGKPQVAFLFAVLLFMCIFLSWTKKQEVAVVILYKRFQPFSGPRYTKRIDILLVGLYKRVGKSVISVIPSVKRPKGLVEEFMAVKKPRTFPSFVIFSYFEHSQEQQKKKRTAPENLEVFFSWR